MQINQKESPMKKEKAKIDTTEQTDIVDELAAEKIATLKNKKKPEQVDETLSATPKTKKTKSEKAKIETVEPKAQKVLKEDKLTKFLVSMKNMVRKSIKKEAAEAGISMNDYIVLAVEEKLCKASPKL
jgi:predicted HicB family RNase H-like nuclease